MLYLSKENKRGANHGEATNNNRNQYANTYHLQWIERERNYQGRMLDVNNRINRRRCAEIGVYTCQVPENR